MIDSAKDAANVRIFPPVVPIVVILAATGLNKERARRWL